MRFRAILQDTEFENRLGFLVDHAKNEWLRDLGKNDFKHSNNVEKYLDRLVPDKIKSKFDEAEIFVLLYGVHLHDIGRKTDNFGHEKETYNKILANPEKYFLTDKYEATAVANVCYGHAKESEKSIRSIDKNYGVASLGDKPLNLQFLASLLRLADDIDNAYTRVQGVKCEETSPRKLIRFVDIDIDRWIIEFQCEPITNEDIEKLTNIQNSTQERLDEIRDILESKGLLYYQIRLHMDKSQIEKRNIQKKVIDIKCQAVVGIDVRKLENNILNIMIGNKEVPYLKMTSKDDECILYGDIIFNLSDQTYYCCSHTYMNIEKLENILKIYYNNFSTDSVFNQPTFSVNQKCDNKNISYSWIGYGFENFIRTIKEKNRRYHDAGIIDAHHSETAGFVTSGIDHIFYIALNHEIRIDMLRVEIGFVFENILFDNRKYLEFYRNIDIEIPNFVYQDKKDWQEPMKFRNINLELKNEGVVVYKENKEYWISGLVYKNPFNDNKIYGDLSQHDKIIANIVRHDPIDIHKKYHLRGASIIQIPNRSFKLEILNIKCYSSM